MIPVCGWGLQCGNDVVDAVKKLEQRAGQVVASGFRVMEPFRDQEIFRELASVLLNESSKCNMSSMKALVKEILMRRCGCGCFAIRHSLRSTSIQREVCSQSVHGLSLSWELFAMGNARVSDHAIG